VPSSSEPVSAAPRHQGIALATLIAFAALVAWDASGWDWPLAAWAAGPGGFPLRDHWLLSQVLHEGGRRLSWLVALALCLGVWWPLGPLRRLPAGRRLQLAVATLAAAAAVSLLKGVSTASCPWDLHAFGGFARYASHWQLQPDGGSGHCFPAGHASSGFAFMAGYFAFEAREPVLARWWLAAAVAVGLLFGIAQQLRGAHFMSHTLWSAWICWVVAWAIHRAWPAPALEIA
jgi:membrane-associated PAP2 superfamily phosphatase